MTDQKFYNVGPFRKKDEIKQGFWKTHFIKWILQDRIKKDRLHLGLN